MRFEIGNLKLFGFDLNTLFQRWLNGIRDIMPAGLGQSFLRPAPRIEARVTEQQLDIIQVDGVGRRTPIASLDEKSLEVALDRSLRSDVIRNIKSPSTLVVRLLIPDSKIMRCKLTLPDLASNNLREIVAYQASRLTPFSADKLFFDVRLLQKNQTLGVVEVEFVAVLKTLAQPWIDQVERLTGCTVSHLGIHNNNNEDISLYNLFGKSRASSQWWRRLNYNSFLLITLMVTLLGTAITPVYKARNLVLERKQEIAQLDNQAAGLLDIRNKLDDELLPLNQFINYRDTHARSSQVISELSRVIAEDIYLVSFSLQDEMVTISGTGTGVVDLIEKINSSSLFFGAKFTSSLNRNARTGQDQFTAMFYLKKLGDEE